MSSAGAGLESSNNDHSYKLLLQSLLIKNYHEQSLIQFQEYVLNRGATEDGATCCRVHKLHVFPYFITIGDILQY